MSKEESSTPQSKKTRSRRGEKKKTSSLPHIDEKWLVSYSDMMTLLFGLFVMLYSIAMEKQGDENKLKSALAAISSQSFGGKSEASSTAAPSPSPTTLPEQKESPEKAELNQAETKIKDLNESLSAQQAQQEILKSENQKLQEQISQLENNLNKTAEDLKEKDAAIKNKATSLQSEKNNLAAQQEQKEKELQNAEKKIENLQREIASLQSQEKIVLLSANWNQEKYDIDLQLTNPQGKVYNFKNQKHASSKTAFLSQATQGPGSEIIRIDPSEEGEYKILVSVYNNRGETKPAQVQIMTFGPFGESKIQEIELDGNKQREKEVTFKIEKSGKLIK